MTLKQIAAQLSLPESTLRLYRDEFDEFVAATGEGRRRRYESGALEILKRIVEWKRQGWSAASIRVELSRTATPQEKRRAVTQEDRIAQIASAMEMQSGDIALLRAEVGALRAEIGRLVGLLQSSGKSMEAVQQERLRMRSANPPGAERS